MSGTVKRAKITRKDLALWDGRTKDYERIDASGGTVSGITVDDFVDVLQVFGSGQNKTRQAIADAVRFITTSNTCTLLFSTGTWTIDDNLTVPANFTCRIPAGCVFDVASGKTLTFSGPVFAESSSFYSGSGTTVLADNAIVAGQPWIKRTPAEIAALVTPTDFSKKAANPERYATNTTPGTTDMTTALANAALVSAAGGGDIVVSSQIRVTANTTLPAGATLAFEQGGSITVDSGDTLTINSKIKAGRLQVFYGSGTVVYGGPLANREAIAYPEWFGAVHDNSTNDRDALAKALAMITLAYGAMSLGNGYYRCTSSLTLPSRIRIFGTDYESVIAFAPTANDDSLFEDDAGGTSDCIFDTFGIVGAGSATGKRAFTISSAANGYKWRTIDFSQLNDWAISHDSAQHIDVDGCKFGSIHNATDTGVAIRTTTYCNRATFEKNRFFGNDRDIIIATGSAISICGNGFEGTGSSTSTPRLSVNLVSVSGFRIDANYFEATRTATTSGVIELEDCYSGSVDCNHMAGDEAGTTYADTFVQCVDDCRGIRVNNNTFNEILDDFVSAGDYAIECHGNRYIDGNVQLTTYQDVVAKMGAPHNIDLDLPLTFTYDPGNLVDGAGETSSGQTMTGATFGDVITVAAPYNLQGIVATAYVSASDTVVVRLQNESGGAVDLASGTWKLFRKAGNL